MPRVSGFPSLLGRFNNPRKTSRIVDIIEPEIPESIFASPMSKENSWTGFKKMTLAPGVQYIAPPVAEMEETIKSHITPFMDSIPEGKVGGVFGILTVDNNGNKIANGVVAIKVEDRIEIAGYIAKNWGNNSIVYGVESKFYF